MEHKETTMAGKKLLPICFLLVGLLHLIALTVAAGEDFVYSGFTGTNLILDGAASVTSDGLLELTNGTIRQKGHAIYPTQLRFRDQQNTTTPAGASAAVRSFSASFVFGILSGYPDVSAHGIALFIAASKDFSAAMSSQYLGLFNDGNNGNATYRVFAVELDTMKNNEFKDISDNHVGIDVNSLVSFKSTNAGYYSDDGGGGGGFHSLTLISHEAMQAWVDYDGEDKKINVTLAPLTMGKPARPLLSTAFDLSTVIPDMAYIGFSSSTGLVDSRHYVLGWSFAMDGPAPAIDIAKLPKLPPEYYQPNGSKGLIVLIATGLASIAVIMLALTVWYRRKRQPVQRGHVIDGMLEETMHDQENMHLSSEEDEEDDGGRTSCQLYSYQVLEDATCRFSSRNKLGSGGFGTVYKGTLENGKEVAVKRLRDSKRTIQELEREISIVVNLRHKNLVRFLGYCFQEEGRFLVYEYVPNNSLDKFWYKASFQCEKLEWATWFNIILGVARGLQFLHNKGIIHRDLKPHNVLLDDNFNPKIADFDLMRMYDKQKTHESTGKVAGTFGYMAPECTSGRKFLLSVKSDVYSYGVLVLEIITGHKIYTFEGQHSEGLVEYVWQHWTEKRASDVVDGNMGVEGQEHAARQALRCVHVALLCVQSDRARRPTMGQVIAMLSSGDDGPRSCRLPEPSLPGYVVRPTTTSGAQLCFGCR